MNWNRIERPWHRVRVGLKSTYEAVYGALSLDWLAKLRLRDHYAEKMEKRRPS
jgi:hypothetical protein